MFLYLLVSSDIAYLLVLFCSSKQNKMIIWQLNFLILLSLGKNNISPEVLQSADRTSDDGDHECIMDLENIQGHGKDSFQKEADTPMKHCLVILLESWSLFILQFSFLFFCWKYYYLLRWFDAQENVGNLSYSFRYVNDTHYFKSWDILPFIVTDCSCNLS